MPSERIKYLFDRYINNTITTAELNELADFIIQNKNDEQLHELMKASWNKEPLFNQPEEKAKEIFREIISHKTIDLPKRQPIHSISRWTVAASIIIIAGIAGWFYISKSIKHPQPLATTTIASKSNPSNRRYIQLPDGSKVILNQGSTINYERGFTGSTREVHLTGEAFFDIAAMNNKPFIVHTGNVHTTVLGTSFNINAYQKNIVITVSTGKVKVENKYRAIAIVTPNKQVTVNAESDTNSNAQVVNVNKEADWKKADLVFDDAQMEEITLALEMRFDVLITFSDATLKKKHVTATFRYTQPLTEILEILTRVNDLKYTMTNNTITISRM